MTTEIAVFNRLGVSLATDSAVTISGNGRVKIFDTADKLFELSNTHPVGIMINGNMDYMGLPWEIAIKDFRSSMGGGARRTVDDWMTEVVAFVGSHKAKAPDASKRFVMDVINREVSEVRQRVANIILRELGQPASKRRKSDISVLLSQVVTSRHDYLKEHAEIDDVETVAAVDRLRSEYEALIREHAASQFEPVVLTDDQHAAIVALVIEAIRRTVPSDNATGVVIAGYGAEDTFPSVCALEIDGELEGRPRCYYRRTESTEGRSERAGVVYFAQTDVIERLLGGVDPRFVEKTGEFIKSAIIRAANTLKLSKEGNDKSTVFADRLEKIAQLTREEYEDATAKQLKAKFKLEFERMVALMPKQELIELAEALVSITAVERKASSDEGTVGGPIDVAFITRHEGFVWIKRKHYFDKELNPRYFWRRFGMIPAGG